MSFFEAIMLICFGVSWPVSIAKSLRTKVVSGKSPLFMEIVWIGYLGGIIHKVLYSPDWIILLYAFNMIMVTINIALYYKYVPRERQTVTILTGEKWVHEWNLLELLFCVLPGVIGTIVIMGTWEKWPSLTDPPTENGQWFSFPFFFIKKFLWKKRAPFFNCFFAPITYFYIGKLIHDRKKILK